MIGDAMFGTNDLPRAAAFYDASRTTRRVSRGQASNRPSLTIVLPDLPCWVDGMTSTVLS